MDYRYSIIETLKVKGRGTALIVRVPDDQPIKVGDTIELLSDAEQSFTSRIAAIDALHVSPPPAPGLPLPYCVLLADEPDAVPTGSSLRVVP